MKKLKAPPLLKALPLALAALLLLAACGGRAAPTSYIYAAPPGSEWYPDTSGAASHAMPEEALAAKDENVVEIREKMFIAQSNDIYLNPGDYLGKTIRYEGIYVAAPNPDGSATHYVIRYGPGCCGYDGEAGFEVAWDAAYPAQDAWVEATGVLEEYELNGWPILRLALTSLEEKTKRGAEFVSQ